MKTPNKLLFPLRLLGVAAVYLLLARLALTWFSPQGVIGVFWPASGLALAVLFMGGRRYAWGVFAGSFVAELLMGLPIAAAVGASAGAAAGALLGHWLLARDRKFDANLQTMGDYGRLIGKGAVPASALSAFIGVNSLTAFGSLTPADVDANMLHWGIGDALGIMLITPLILIWRQQPDQLMDRKRWPEAALVMGLTLLVGQIIFLGWLPDLLPGFPRKGYWLLPLALWAASRLGPHGVIAMLCAMTVQAMHGIHENTGFLANPQVETRLIDGWFFITIGSLVVMFLAMYIKGLRQAEATLRIAAIAFECQEGISITDAHQVILRANQAFSRIMGYSSAEVVGKSMTMLRSDRHPPDFYLAIQAEVMRSGQWRGEIWYRRKNGEVFPQWMTITAVHDAAGVITHNVITHVDIADQKQQEAKRLAEETVHRDALVREVHHRIKNNLQGITGILRQYSQAHPELADIINQAINQVRGIAVLHGLQGRTSMDTVRLCELTSAIAGDVSSVWQTPIAVDIPESWAPCIIAEKEAVPIALVLNELMVNAIKHGGQAQGHVGVMLRKGLHEDAIQVLVRNSGRLRNNTDRPPQHPAGLLLIDSLMPREGARLTRIQLENEVLTTLELEPPVLHLERIPH